MEPIDLNFLEKQVAEKRAKLSATQEILKRTELAVINQSTPTIVKPSSETDVVETKEIDSCFASLDKILESDQGSDQRKHSLHNIMYAIQH